ncbi:uncharacterized protein N7515_002045 [Penicillium bovifimosum]|uniref:Extracellular membrane protein CFEM domain-containing protein n=1 Tax=Penicillium bovifimosum TaxID=126998 RepID=A0A9W9HD02_9EURO|nr:uncharacterized protein N7515_002045 [Penicillium bovifimosum]KAJ5143258.1 hypothetical protein N7515_002045 [Penicillium bovifimosum]
MRFFPLAVLGLASVAVADFSSWNDVVGDAPQCLKKCTNDFYNDVGLDDQCGSSDQASVKCLCGVSKSTSDLSAAADSLSSCVTDNCSAEELTDAFDKVMAFSERFTDLASQCTEEVADDKDGGASSVVPAFGAMLVSGALLFASVAF